MSLEKTKMKAIIEAMLFVSEKPVTLRQMIHKIRQARERDREFVAQENGQSLPEALEPTTASLDLNVRDIHSSLEDLLPAAVANAEPQEVDDVLQQLIDKNRELESEVSREDIKAILDELMQDYAREDRGFELVFVGKGYQLRTKYGISHYLKDDKKTAFVRLSPSAMETLAIVAYKQPVARGEIEGIRGVDTGGVLKTLLDREFLRIVGRSEEPGRPLVYGTTAKFLEVFGLTGLKDLPNPREFIDMEIKATEARAVEEGIESDEGPRFIAAGDFMEGADVDLSESERAILEELDESLDQLKAVEKGITVFGDESVADAGEDKKVG